MLRIGIIFLGLAGFGQSLQLIKDLNPSNHLYGTDQIEEPVRIGNQVVFRGSDDIHGNELWISDGTATGTKILKDIGSGTDGTPSQMVAVGNKVFFSAYNRPGHSSLWVTDGTSQGTFCILDSDPGGLSNPILMGAVDHLLIFLTSTPASGVEIWRTDGTTVGTFQLKETVAGTGGINYFFGAQSKKNELFFGVQIGSQADLWKTDGTATGTSKVKTVGDYMGALHLINDLMVFFVTTPANGTEPWVSDGTTAGTNILLDIDPGPNSGLPFGDFTEINGFLYFAGHTPAQGNELWRTDGTTMGTSLFLDIEPGPTGSEPNVFGTLQGLLCFWARTPAFGEEMWRTDGTVPGTQMIEDMNPGPDWFYSDTVFLGNKIYFYRSDGTHGEELWETNGFDSGTQLAVDIWPGTSSSAPNSLRLANNKIWFLASKDNGNDQPFVSDGTSAGTVALTQSVENGSFPEAFQPGPIPNHYFSASNASAGREFYSTAGSALDTNLISDINVGPNASNPNGFNALSPGFTLFFADDGISGNELWKYDGTSASFVRDLIPGQLSYDGGKIIETGGTIFVANYGGLWITDGTTLGTTPIYSGPVFDLTEFNGKVVFYSFDAAGYEPWISDGTVGGTMMLKDIEVGSSSSVPSDFFVYSGTLYFSAQTAAAGRELWKSDGTTANTVLFMDHVAGVTGSNPTGFVRGLTHFFYKAKDALGRYQIWYCDGSSNPMAFTTDLLGVGEIFATDTNVLFSGLKPETGFELFSGTVGGGYSLVLDIWPGVGSSQPNKMTLVGGTLLFWAGDPDNGVRLWATDGSYTGTWALEDLVPGPASMYPGGIWPDGTFPTAFIATNSENENVELYSVPVGPSGYMQVPLAGCPGASTICSVKSDPNYISYVWAVTNGNISSGQGTNTISLLPDASGTMSISCQITDQFGAMVDIQRSVPIYNEIPAPASVTGPSIVCANRADLVFSVDPVPGAVGYQWAVPPGVSVKNFGPNAQSILVDWGTNGGAVTVSTITACGTSTPASLSVSVVSNAVVANAGADLAACGQIQLQANLPPSGSGTWSVVSGPNRLLSQIFEPNNPTSIFSPNLVGTYVLRWTISNACGTTCDDVQVSVSSPPTALAGPDDTALNGMPYPLGGNSPAPYTGMWSVVNGPSLSNSQFSSPSSPTSTFSADGGPGVYVLRWTIFAGCGAFFDDVALTVLGSADLELTAIVPDPNMRLAEVREFEIHLINQGPDAATASVSIGILPGARVTDIVAVNGTVAGNGLWQIPSFTGTATAFVSVRMDGPDPLAPVLFLGQVWTSDLPDPDSTPGNSQVEDDLFSMLLVPYDEVYFPDPNLRNAVINDPNIDVVDDDIITQSEAQLVTSLSVHGQNIADLTGVSAMENLTYLGASFNQITDLPDLTNLGQLVTLEISENRIASLYNFYLYLPTSIQNLFLSGNQLSEINTDLVNLVDLQALDLSSNPISTVPDIFLAFPNLQHIWLSGMGFTELPPSFFLATNLQTIVLSRNPIGNIPDLSMFPGLSLLGLDKTKMDLLPHLATNANLTVFSASGNRLENVTELVLNSSLLTNAGHFVDVSNNFLSPDDCPEITQLDARVQTSGASFLYENQGNGHVLAPEFPNWPFQPNTLMNWVQDISNEIYLYHLTCP